MPRRTRVMCLVAPYRQHRMGSSSAWWPDHHRVLYGAVVGSVRNPAGAVRPYGVLSLTSNPVVQAVPTLAMRTGEVFERGADLAGKPLPEVRPLAAALRRVLLVEIGPRQLVSGALIGQIVRRNQVRLQRTWSAGLCLWSVDMTTGFRTGVLTRHRLDFTGKARILA